MDDETPEIVAEEELVEAGLHAVEEGEEEVGEIDPIIDTDDLLGDKKKITDDADEDEDPELSDEKEVEDYMFDALYGDR